MFNMLETLSIKYVEGINNLGKVWWFGNVIKFIDFYLLDTLLKVILNVYLSSCVWTPLQFYFKQSILIEVVHSILSFRLNNMTKNKLHLNYNAQYAWSLFYDVSTIRICCKIPTQLTRSCSIEIALALKNRK